MRFTVHQVLIVLSATALAVLLIVQIAWFSKAYRLEEQQFDDRVNLALREVADHLLDHRGDHDTKIPPVSQESSNSYMISVNASVSYTATDSLIRYALIKQRIDLPFSLTVRDQKFDSIVLGYTYSSATSPEKASCIDRGENQTAAVHITLTFPNKKGNLLAEHSFWITSAVVFTIVTLLGAYLIFDLSRQHRITLMKNEFINNMTHELNTPIANIAMASEVLRTEQTLEQKEKAKRYIDIIHEENLRLKLHVEQVLRTVQLERGELKLEREKVDVNELLTDVARQFSPRVKIKHGQIISRFQAINAIVVGDAFHLRNMFSNLLDNAEKYSPLQPEITIETSNTENSIEIKVMDNGLGIARDALQHVFDKFYRASTGLQHDIKGFGLGLTYVQQIVNAHGGRIDVESEKDKGSCFRVSFPIPTPISSVRSY